MITEYEFRVWDGELNMWYRNDVHITFGDDGYWSCHLNGTGEYCCDSTHEGAVLMMYAGQKDKNGKKIFEGDIVNGCMFNSSYAYGQVVRDIDNGGFIVHGIGKFIEGCSEVNNPFIEVIGNIYQNKN